MSRDSILEWLNSTAKQTRVWRTLMLMRKTRPNNFTISGRDKARVTAAVRLETCNLS